MCIHDKAITVDLAFYVSAEYYDILNRARNDLKSRSLALLESSGSLAQSTITLAAMIGLLIPYGIWLAFILQISTIPAFLIVLYFNRRTHNMDSGQIVEWGALEELLAQGGRYARSWTARPRPTAAGQLSLNLNHYQQR